ncbi:MAG: hypothetical protein H6662_02895 [Ardenticatenaceae bacterium]|nr:hypothetical protein [Ardenticatenaceae bacterium]
MSEIVSSAIRSDRVKFFRRGLECANERPGRNRLQVYGGHIGLLGGRGGEKTSPLLA